MNKDLRNYINSFFYDTKSEQYVNVNREYKNIM